MAYSGCSTTDRADAVYHKAYSCRVMEKNLIHNYELQLQLSELKKMTLNGKEQNLQVYCMVKPYIALSTRLILYAVCCEL